MASRKKFDCVEMMHRGGAAVQKRLEGLTIDEQVAFWKEEGRKMRARQKKLQRETKRRQTAA